MGGVRTNNHRPLSNPKTGPKGLSVAESVARGNGLNLPDSEVTRERRELILSATTAIETAMNCLSRAHMGELGSAAHGLRAAMYARAREFNG